MVVEPGWHRDPEGAPLERWWDGNQWTDATRARQTPGPQQLDAALAAASPAKRKGALMPVLIGGGLLMVLAVAGCVGLVVVGGEDAANSSDGEESAEGEEASGADFPTLDESAMVIGDRCSFEPNPTWTLVDDLRHKATFSVLPDEPVTDEPEGGPGVFVRVTCTNNDGLTPIENEPAILASLAETDGVTIIEQSEVDISGVSSNLNVVRFGDPDDPTADEVLQAPINVGNSRCSVRVAATPERLAEVRPEIDALLQTIICSSLVE